MNLLFDHQIFTYMERGGAARYFFELVRNLEKLDDVVANCSLIFSNNEYVNTGKVPPAYTFFKHSNFPGRQKLMRMINLGSSHLSLFRGNFDVVHPTYYNPYFLKHKIKQPVVLTCLDMIHEKFMTYDKKAINDKAKTLDRATKIVAISQSTKNDIIEYYRYPAEKIQVIHLASSLAANPRSNDKSTQNNQPYFLYVGLRAGYKNFGRLIKAIAPIFEKNNDIKLYCVGGGKFTNEELKTFETLKMSERVLQLTVSDAELSGIYSKAIGFIFPSLYEGFGIPILEAMACGCPVLTSNTSSMPEVAGDAALYFDPNNTDSIQHAINELLRNDEKRNDLIKMGFRQSDKFSWSRMTQQHYNLYQNLL